jgi:pimeloyl-ACP methyl ester carboxylesterase
MPFDDTHPPDVSEPEGLLRVATREARAFMRLARLLPRDLDSWVPVGVKQGEDVVVLVHGALATAGAWRPLRERFERQGKHVATFTYWPSCGVADIASEIGRVLRQVPLHARIHLIGHSLGGLGVRWFVQELPTDPRIVQTIAVASPFAGARGARFLPGPAGRDMQSGSPVLTRLFASADRCALPHLSIFGTADTAVAPSTSFPVGERMVIEGAGHNMLLFDERVVRSITERVAAARA